MNSLYEDDSKIRDTLSLNTWKKINNKKTNDINIKHVEVFINNRYYGLYGFNEVINEYTLDVQGQDAEIYKINNHNVPKLNTFNNDLLVNDSIEIVYPKSAKNANWEPIKNLIKLNYDSNDQVFEENILKYIDIDNCVDYFILCELTHNADGLWKNNVFKYIKNTKKMLKIPWDFDLTWGACWDETNELMVNYNIETSENLLVENKSENLSGYLEQRLWQNNVGNFRQKVAKRWKELRSGFLETESFVNYANSLYDEVTESGAREREHERWPDGGYSTDNSFIEKFIRQRLPYLDSQFLQYLNDFGGKLMLEYRNEYKYICSEAELKIIEHRLRPIMKVDAHQSGNSYRIRSLYFDDYYRTAFNENEIGIDNRKKFRIRVYDNPKEMIRLEVKYKRRGKTHKDSVKYHKMFVKKLWQGKGQILIKMLQIH